MFLDLHTKVKDQGLNIGVMVNTIYATMLLKSVEWQRNFIMFLNEKNFDFVVSNTWNREILRAAQAQPLHRNFYLAKLDMTMQYT